MTLIESIRSAVGRPEPPGPWQKPTLTSPVILDLDRDLEPIGQSEGRTWYVVRPDVGGRYGSTNFGELQAGRRWVDGGTIQITEPMARRYALDGAEEFLQLFMHAPGSLAERIAPRPGRERPARPIDLLAAYLPDHARGRDAVRAYLDRHVPHAIVDDVVIPLGGTPRKREALRAAAPLLIGDPVCVFCGRPAVTTTTAYTAQGAEIVAPWDLCDPETDR